MKPLTYDSTGTMARPDSTFRDFISKNGDSKFPAEKGRYALYLSPSCPWAHRTLIVHSLKGLESIVDVYRLHWSISPDGWYFSGEGDSPSEDPLYGFKRLRQLYEKADSNFSGRVTVPVLWDKETGTIVNNESSEIIRMFYTEFDDFLPEGLREADKPGGGLYPEPLRKNIDEMNRWVYDTVNNGVYKVGFAKTQAAYDANIYPLFASLDRLEAHLAHGKPFLFGDHLTEADVRLYTTIARFDVAYHTVFMCNLKTVRHDYPRLHAWFRRLYWGRDDRETRGAFYKTTEPYLKYYGRGYAGSRHIFVFDGQGPCIAPAGPSVLIDPLPENVSTLA